MTVFNDLLEKYGDNLSSYRVSINDISGDGYELSQKLFNYGASIIVPNVQSDKLSKVISELSGSMFRYKVVPQPTIHLEQVDLLVNFNKEIPNGHAAKQIFNVQRNQDKTETISKTAETPKRGRPVRRNVSE